MATSNYTIDALPSELRAQIFRLLPFRDRVRCERVSRLWHTLLLAQGYSDICVFNEDKPAVCGSSTSLQKGKEKIERTSHHHHHVPGPTGEGEHERVNWRFRILLRIGSGLISAAMLGVRAPSILHRDLELCPKLEHLALWEQPLHPTTSEHLGRSYGTRMRSLVLHNCLTRPSNEWPEEERRDPGPTMDAFNRALSHFSALEYLYMYEEDYDRIFELRFSPTMANLRNLSLHTYQADEQIDGGRAAIGLLSGVNLSALSTQLPALRSLTLDHMARVRSFSFLQEFTRLEHLSTRVAGSNIGSFIDALPHMESLRALDVLEPTHSGVEGAQFDLVVEKLLLGLGGAPLLCQRLEHLGIYTIHLVTERHNFSKPQLDETLDGVHVGLLANLSKLERLSSLELHWYQCCREWNWLKEMSQLEHLALRPIWFMPLEVACEVIGCCQKLRYFDRGDTIHPTEDGGVSPFELSVLIDLSTALSPSLSTTQGDGDESVKAEVSEENPEPERQKQHNSVNIRPTLCVQLRQHNLSKHEPSTISSRINSAVCAASPGSRVKFTVGPMTSHILERYEFGCIENEEEIHGKPALMNWNERVARGWRT